MSILLFQSNSDKDKMNPRHSDFSKAKKGSGRVRQMLEKRKGKIEYTTGEDDTSTLNICVQSFKAKPDNVARISIRIIEPLETFGHEEHLEQLAERREEEERKLSAHSSRIANELDTFIRRLEELQRNADNAKQKELEFHGKSIALNKAVKYWPIFRIVILVVAGYIQATHVIGYMKSKHIY